MKVSKFLSEGEMKTAYFIPDGDIDEDIREINIPEDKMIFQIPGMLSGIKTMAHFWRLSFDTQENISGDAIARFTELKDKMSWMTVSHKVIEPQDILDLPDIKTPEPKEKTPAQRLRAVLYLLWKQHNEGFKTDTEHYNYYMEKMIEHVKSKWDK